MQKKCQCCGAELNGSKCAYCGFREIIDMDESGTELLRTIVSSHKKRVIEGITDISVVSYLYEWNAKRAALEKKKREVIKLADGTDCYLNDYWAKQDFGQMPAEKVIRLEISYYVNGNEKQLTVTLPSVSCDDFWKLGLHIDETLRLQIFLGTKKNHTSSEWLALDLK